MTGVFRSGFWPGLPPTVGARVMCSDCKYHRAAPAGWQWDRCEHPDADMGSVVRNDQRPTCADIRLSEDQCGRKARWFERSEATPQDGPTGHMMNTKSSVPGYVPIIGEIIDDGVVRPLPPGKG